jgi:hypothetical protein
MRAVAVVAAMAAASCNSAAGLDLCDAAVPLSSIAQSCGQGVSCEQGLICDPSDAGIASATYVGACANPPPNGPCGSGSPCPQGSVCETLGNQQPQCMPCGSMGQHCCEVTIGGGLLAGYCNRGLACAGFRCDQCGLIGQYCCSGIDPGAAHCFNAVCGSDGRCHAGCP